MPKHIHAHPAAVLLDFDGVIADSFDLHIRGWQHAVETVLQRPLQRLPRAPADMSPPLTERFLGKPTNAIARTICREMNAAGGERALIRAKEHYLSTAPDVPPACEGAVAFMEFLISASLPIAVGSNSPGPYVSRAMHSYGFPEIPIVTPAPSCKPKPAPDIWLECARQLDLSYSLREKIWVLDDSPTGIRAAVSAGMHGIGITTEVPDAVLTHAGAAWTAPNLGKIMLLLVDG